MIFAVKNIVAIRAVIMVEIIFLLIFYIMVRKEKGWDSAAIYEYTHYRHQIVIMAPPCDCCQILTSGCY